MRHEISRGRQLGLFLALLLVGCGSSPSGTVAPISGATPDPTTTPVAPPTPIPPSTPTPTPDPTLATFSASLNDSSIFTGASIIQRWPLPLHDAGISGQTSAQVLQRFQGDVVGHGYARVIIQVGSNDILQGVKDPPSTVAANIASMGQIARAANLDVVLMSLGPISQNGRSLDAAAAAVNAKIYQLAGDQGYTYIDIFTPMQGHPEYFLDGLHPTATGYSVMERALAQSVTK